SLAGLWWDRALGQAPSGWKRWLRGLAAALLLHAYLFVRSVVHYPQLYSEAFYDRGGVRRSAMIWLTDHLTSWMLDAGMALVVLPIVGLPLVWLRGRQLAWRGWRALAGARRLRWPAAIALVAVLVVLGIATRRRGHGHTTGQPNVLLLAVDSLRA